MSHNDIKQANSGQLNIKINKAKRIRVYYKIIYNRKQSISSAFSRFSIAYFHSYVVYHTI